MKMQVEVRAWQVPNNVILKVPVAATSPDPVVPLSEVDPEVLSMLCDEFRASVFKKAGKSDPRERLCSK